MSLSLGLGLALTRNKGGGWNPARLGSDVLLWADGYQTSRMSLDGSNNVLALGSWRGEGLYARDTGTADLDPASAPNLSGGATVFANANNDMLVQRAPIVSATLVSATTLPDGALRSLTGKGFTITGLTRANDDTWWATNFGSYDESDTMVTPSVVRLSSDRSSILSEVALSSFAGSASTGAQGVAWESATSVWVASQGDNKIYNFNGQTGALIGSLSKAANGLAYDSANSRLVTMDINGKIEWINKSTAAVVQTLHIGDGTSNFDHLSIAGNYLLATQGANRKTGKVHFIDLTTFTLVATARLPEVKAIEGVWFDGVSSLYVASDERYHNDSTDTNRILQYSVILPPAPLVVSDRFLVAMLFKHPNTFTGARCLFQIGDPLENTGLGAGFGVYTVANVTNSISVFASKGPGSGARSSATIAADISTDCLVTLDVNMSAGTMTPRINGVPLTPVSLANVAGGSLSNTIMRLGAALEASAQARRSDLNLTGAAAVVKNGHLKVAEIEGYMAWAIGKQTLLPTNHPYRYYAPGKPLVSGPTSAAVLLSDGVPWFQGAGTVTQVGARVRVAAGSGVKGSGLKNAVATVSGERYLVTGKRYAGATSLDVYASSTNSYTVYEGRDINTGDGDFAFTFTANASSTGILARTVSTTSGEYGELQDVYIQRIS